MTSTTVAQTQASGKKGIGKAAAEEEMAGFGTRPWKYEEDEEANDDSTVWSPGEAKVRNYELFSQMHTNAPLDTMNSRSVFIEYCF